MPLSTAPATAAARVVHIAADSDDAARLKAMGLCIGRRVQVVKAGDPLIVSVVGARVGLSARLAANVLIQPLGEASGETTAAAELTGL
jgi:Fe2+ transport system protein FeoA